MMRLCNSKTFFVFLFLFLFHQHSLCQQIYFNETRSNDPTDTESARPRGYRCDGYMSSCKSFVSFRSRAPYNTSTRISSLFGTKPSEIALLNNISSPQNIIPTNKLLIVPISCVCAGNIFQFFTTYSLRKDDSYYEIASSTYQGLFTYRSLAVQNYDHPTSMSIGSILTIPVRCACPSKKQSEKGVNSLLTYMVDENDTVTSVGDRFGLTGESIKEANMLFGNKITLYSDTPILVPLGSQSCSVYPGIFFCKCRKGQIVNGSSSEGTSCISPSKRVSVRLVTLIGSGIGIGLLCLFLSGYKSYTWMKKRKENIQKEEFFKQNGGLLLQEKFSYLGGSEKAKLFNADELESATDKYNKNRVLGQGGYGTVYKGMLPDGTIVAVKKAKEMHRGQTEQFINEVIILSQINHKNIVKLLGCCLETELPTLVYEFISNGSLSDHIHNHKRDLNSSQLSWENRFTIARDVAGALAYMHSAVSMPIYHRDIKSSNILLDEMYNAKVSDFGTSRSIPYDKTHLTTAVQGTLGYMDPEYFYTSQFTDKSDVYSFGVTLVELLTGENPFSFAKDEGKNLVALFISLTKENKLSLILDPQVASNGVKEEIQAIAELATRCLTLNGKRRPTMKQVSLELEGIRRSQRCLQIDDYLSRSDELSYVQTDNDTTQEIEKIDFSKEINSISF